MNLFGKDFYRALTIGFLIGTAAMAATVSTAQLHASPLLTSR
jgi:hypothetical protein